jgi:hypothetical protein
VIRSDCRPVHSPMPMKVPRNAEGRLGGSRDPWLFRMSIPLIVDRGEPAVLDFVEEQLFSTDLENQRASSPIGTPPKTRHAILRSNSGEHARGTVMRVRAPLGIPLTVSCELPVPDDRVPSRCLPPILRLASSLSIGESFRASDLAATEGKMGARRWGQPSSREVVRRIPPREGSR